MTITKLIENEQGGIRRIGRYELIAEIASGGMATVYLARLSGVGGFQRNVAIKCLHPHLANNDEFVEMFLDEARLAALIHHPNVVPIQEVGEGEAGYYLVMDYIEGDTFAALLSKAAVDGKQVPREISLRILVDMLAGLHAAHELRDDHGRNLGLVHRDVSPQNILVGTDGVTRITDFGVARAASRLSATRAGQLKGKLAYMAPEQANGDEDIDRRADVFSAGVVLWEALALKRLFKASNEAATLNRVLNDRIVSPREFSTHVPEAVAEVCMRALHRDLGVRYVSCAEFGDALERVASASNCLASSRDVATYVNEIVGASIESHRIAIREWLERRASEPPTPASAIRSPVVPVPPPPPSRRSNAIPLGETSAITRASGLHSRPSRPLPPPAASQPGFPPQSFAGSATGVAAESVVVPSFAVYPNTTLVSSAPALEATGSSRKRVLLVAVGIGALTLVAVAVALTSGAFRNATEVTAPGVSSSPVDALPGLAAGAEQGVEAAEADEADDPRDAPGGAESADPGSPATTPVEADQLPSANDDADEQEGVQTSPRRRAGRSRDVRPSSQRPRPAPKPKRTAVEVDLDNPYK